MAKLHEILADQLVTACTVHLQKDGLKATVSEILAIVTALRDGDMRTTDARWVAERIAGITRILRSTNYWNLADLVEDLVIKLREREEMAEAT